MKSKPEVRYSFGNLLKAIRVEYGEFRQCEGVQDLFSLAEALEVKHTFPSDRLEVPKEPLKRIVSAALDDIRSDIPFRKSILPSSVRKKLTKRKSKEIHQDRVRAFAFMHHLLDCDYKQSLAFKNTLIELEIDDSTLYRSLRRICPTPKQ